MVGAPTPRDDGEGQKTVEEEKLESGLPLEKKGVPLPAIIIAG